MSRWSARALRLEDLAGLAAVQRACYGSELLESADVFAKRIASDANCSLVLEVEGRVCAYLAAYHSRAKKVTPLHGDFDAISEPDTLYLHDMAVLSEYAGQGLARALLKLMRQRASESRLRYSGLVSVQGSEAYWKRQGYAPCELKNPAEQRNLASYGEGAVYMVCELGPVHPSQDCTTRSPCVG
ncbi:GNAT family N-acetyltransferase [Diaphorobacter aerolatus]|uniref:GNAT family N-acetyltransferase n=1 Tax=Diaphorobacter aerolatus TaxID=1288495 RepID=A0A7H0GQI2_9BURK|nr:GNAT family N-acetyltransferase [Diaphorobacter aerolatus]